MGRGRIYNYCVGIPVASKQFCFKSGRAAALFSFSIFVVICMAKRSADAMTADDMDVDDVVTERAPKMPQRGHVCSLCRASVYLQ